MVNLDYLYNPEAAKPHFTKNYFVDKKLGFQVIEHGMILPHKRKINNQSKDYLGFGGIVDEKGEYVKSSSVHNGIGASYTPPQESIQSSSETVVYVGMFAKTWGHVITDDIRRLWFLKSEVFKSEFKNCPLVCVKISDVGAFLQPGDSFYRLLEILEIEVDRFREITQPTKFEKIILPDETFYGSREFTKEYCETIERVKDFALKNKSPTSSKKIYYFHGARQIGEERLAEYFKSKGYAIIQPEKLPLEEQLNILINAERFAATIGSTSHNSLFLREGTEVILIPRGERNVLNNYQQALNQVNSVNANYLDSTFGLFSNGYGNILYIISPQLKRFFGDKWTGYEEEDLKNFMQYFKASMSRGIIANPEWMTYYEPILPEFVAQLKRREDLLKAHDMPPRWETFQPTLIYQIHVASKGWGSWLDENQISNPLDQQLDIQAIRIKFPGVYYSVYYNAEEGWSEEVTTGETAGTTGKRKPINGMRAHLDEVGTKGFNILYRMHKFDGTWTAWAKNGEILYSHGQKLNAIQIKLEPVNLHAAKESDNALPPLEKHNDTYSPRQDVTKF